MSRCLEATITPDMYIPKGKSFTVGNVAAQTFQLIPICQQVVSNTSGDNTIYLIINNYCSSSTCVSSATLSLDAVLPTTSGAVKLASINGVAQTTTPQILSAGTSLIGLTVNLGAGTMVNFACAFKVKLGEQKFDLLWDPQIGNDPNCNN